MDEAYHFVFENEHEGVPDEGALGEVEWEHRHVDRNVL